VPDGRILGHVNVIFAIFIACVGGNKRKKRGSGDWVRDPKLGQLTLSMRLARAEVGGYIQRPLFQVRRLFIH
jgi:hypothetical protein